MHNIYSRHMHKETLGIHNKTIAVAWVIGNRQLIGKEVRSGEETFNCGPLKVFKKSLNHKNALPI